MIRIHIVLVLLKIIGILLLVVLSLILLAIFLILFVPVRYQAYGYRDSQISKGIIRVFWLAHLISCKVSYDSHGKKIKWSVKIFGISIQKVTAWKKKRKSRKQNTERKKTRKKETERKETETVLKAKEIQENIEQEQNRDVAEQEQKRKKVNIFQKIKKNIGNSPNNSSKS